MRFINNITRQISILFLLVFAPIVWLYYFPIIIDYNCLILSLGLLMLCEGKLYLNLQIDIIPDCIPIGKKDDGFAYILMTIGLCLTLFSLLIILF